MAFRENEDLWHGCFIKRQRSKNVEKRNSRKSRAKSAEKDKKRISETEKTENEGI